MVKQIKAFPYEGVDDYGFRSRSSGMDLRDYIATSAMQGMLANQKSHEILKSIPEYAYDVADAMMREREKRNMSDK